MVGGKVVANFGLDGKAIGTLTRWLDDRTHPVLDVLPYHGYRDNQVVEWLLTPIDADLLAVAGVIQEMSDNLTPLSESDKWLDYLALLLGFTGYGFWDYSWPILHKQRLLTYAMLIWERLGTLWTLETVLWCLELPYSSIWQGIGGFLAANPDGDDSGGIVAASQDDPNGTPIGLNNPYLAFVRMPRELMRWDTQWLLARQCVKYFTPAVSEVEVVYEYFYADLSVAGDPVF